MIVTIQRHRSNESRQMMTRPWSTTRLGSPDDLKYLIDKLHEAGLLELLNSWVGVCWGKTPCSFKRAPFFFLSGLSGGFKHFLFSPLPGEMIQFDSYFSDGLKPPASFFLETFRCISGVFPFPQEMGNAFKKKGVFFWVGRFRSCPKPCSNGKASINFFVIFVTKKRSSLQKKGPFGGIGEDGWSDTQKIFGK